MLSTCLHELFQSDTDWFGSHAFVFLLLFLCNLNGWERILITCGYICIRPSDPYVAYLFALKHRVKYSLQVNRRIDEPIFPPIIQHTPFL